MPIVAVIAVTIVVKGNRHDIKASDNMTIARMMVVIPVIAVRVRIIPVIIIAPAVVIPAIILPTVIPVFAFIIIVMRVIFLIGMIVIHATWSIPVAPGFVIAAVFAIG